VGGFALIDIQNALYALLSTDSVLKEAGWGVYDFVPLTPSPYPYIKLGEDSGIPDDCKDDGDGQTRDITEIVLHFFSRKRGTQEMKLAMQRVNALLHNKEESFSVAFQHVTLLRRLNVACFIEPDGKTEHGVLKFSITTATGG